jgi:hypothetical protein
MLQSLPTALNNEQLDELLASLPCFAEITRRADIVTVHATSKRTKSRDKVISAAMVAPDRWHVMARAGLISTQLDATH